MIWKKNINAILVETRLAQSVWFQVWGEAFHHSITNTCWFGHRSIWLLIWTVAWEILFLDFNVLAHVLKCPSWFLGTSLTHTLILVVRELLTSYLLSVRCSLCILLFCRFHCDNFFWQISWLHCARSSFVNSWQKGGENKLFDLLFGFAS